MKVMHVKVFLIVFVLVAASSALFFSKEDTFSCRGVPGDVVELTFGLDKKFEFGEYYFNLENGKAANYSLCFCLTEKNMFPPDCFGDVKYIYNNTPGTMCVPLDIGTGRCSTKIMSSSSFATVFLIPLEYQWTKPVEKIVMGIEIPEQAPAGSRLVVEVSIFKRNDRGHLVIYRKYDQSILVENEKKKEKE